MKDDHKPARAREGLTCAATLRRCRAWLRLQSVPFPGLLSALLLAYLVVYVPFLDHVPLIAVDEPWYGNTAHNFATGHGLVNTIVGERGGDQFFLYTVVVSGFFKAFGTSLWTGRFASMVIGLVATCGLVLLCRGQGIRGWPLVGVSGLFITSNVFFIIFRRLRPEALVIALTIWALHFFVDAWRTRRFRSAMISALLAGSSVLAHPSGGILAVLLGLLLAARTLHDRRNLRAVLGYITGGILTILMFPAVWHLLRDESFLQFINDAFLHSHRVSVSDGSVLSAFISNLYVFIPAYSLGVDRLYIMLFEIGVIFIGLARYRHDRFTGLLSITALLWFITGLALFTPFYRWMFSTMLIFSFVVAGRLLSAEITTFPAVIRKTLWVLTVLCGLNNIVGDAYVVKRNAGNTSYAELTETLDAVIPDAAPVFTNMELWFPFQKNVVYTPFTRWSLVTPYPNLNEFLRSGKIHYAVLSGVFSQGLSPITGRRDYEDYLSNDHLYRTGQEVHRYMVSNCQRLRTLPTRGYGEIVIWDCRSP